MKLLLVNILLAMSWSALTGSASLINFLTGFALGYLALAVTRGRRHGETYFRRLPRMIGLLGFFLRELAASGLRAVREVLSPVRRSRPQIIRVPLALRDRHQILTLAQLLSLTPGTLVLDIAPEQDAFYVHTLFVDDADAFRDEVRSGFERRVAEALS
ncbi:Na+/H+ antiporter subunit E [Microbulbifer magnicolonia]|uniref:Na+/H+ antiporter subunit E n=1 Tax=Microbulbifer magnicolonia TaxID=3109744 RepID=UPI002B40B734|nr:Na+/H+ antiporter subunit E [Microbulbifer sp. GG15]